MSGNLSYAPRSYLIHYLSTGKESQAILKLEHIQSYFKITIYIFDNNQHLYSILHNIVSVAF